MTLTADACAELATYFGNAAGLDSGDADYPDCSVPGELGIELSTL